MAKSDVSRETHPAVDARDSAELVAGNTRFAVNAYKALAARTGGTNLLLSPYSMSIVLAMTLAGAGGETANEMAAAMQWTLPSSRLHRTFDALDEQLAAREEDRLTLRFANSLWASSQVHFEKAFLDTLSRSYGTGVRLTDVAGDPEGSRRRINGWVADATKGNIRDLFAPDSVPSSDSIVLLNAVYFHAAWSQPFKSANTLSEPFWRLDGSKTTAQTMHGGLRTRCMKSGDYDAVELPYVGGQMAMDLVMPKAPLAAFEANLTGDSLGRMLSGMEHATVILSMPRFRFAEPTFSLADVLKGLGMRRAFDPQQADFSPMGADSHGGLFVGDVLHQATIVVNEEGTEAAAATAVRMGTRGAPPEEPVIISIDHPFFFVLRDIPTDTILFAGRVVDPGQDPPRE
jgi:serpin B